MAFTFQVIRGSTTYTLSGDGLPIQLVSVDDLGGASVRNIEESGPFQDGSTHLDYRLEPSTFTLRFNVIGATPTALDGHRDTLNTIFKPVRGVPITLKITRDDGAIRQIDTQRTGRLAIPLEPTHRPGNLHRAVVQLRAADPTWYDPDEDEHVFLSTGNWWLGLNTIGTANVLEHVESPTAAQAWALSGTVAAGSAWTVAARTSPASSAGRYVWDAGSAELNTTGTITGRAVLRPLNSISFPMESGTANYFVIANVNVGTVYVNGTAVGDDASTVHALPTGGRWRSDTASINQWDVAVPRAAVYNIALNDTQRSALSQAMDISGTVYGLAFAYTGDYDTYPIITIQGSVSNPVITNVTTGDVLDFTGGTVGSTDIWTIDTRYGRKSVLNLAGSSVANYLSSDSDLATFRIVPAPYATGGTNTITVANTGAGTSAQVTVAYNSRFMSY